MAEERVHLMSAQDDAHQYVYHMDQAMEASNPDDMRWHIEEAMPFAQAMMDDLEGALSTTEDPDVADNIEGAIRHLSLSMDQADHAVESSDDELEDYIGESRAQAERPARYLDETLGVLPQQ